MPRSNASRTRRDGIVVTLSQVVSGGIGIVTAPLLARALGPVSRGELAAALVWAITLGPLAGLSAGVAARIMISADQERRTVVARRAMVLSSAVASLVAIVTAALLPTLLPDYSDEIVQLGQIALLSLPVGAIGLVSLNLLAASKRYVAMSAVTMAGALLIAALYVLAYVTDRLDVTRGVVVFMIGAVVPTIVGLVVVRGSLRRPTVAERRDAGVTWGQQLWFGTKLSGGQLAATATQRVDQLLLAAFVSPQQLGFYVMAVTISTVARTAGGSVALMAMTRVAETTGDERRRVIGRAVRVNLVVTVPIAVAGIVLAPWGIPLLLGPGFSPVVGLVQLLLVATVGFGVMDTTAQCLAAAGVVGPTVWSSVLGTAITLAVLAAFLERYGATAAAWASIAAYWAVALVLLLVLRHRGLVRLAETVPRWEDVRGLLHPRGDATP